tara:strand:- start:589 stop:816 length:228 start_codon:yes stop_codon:yes gene_type:complete
MMLRRRSLANILSVETTPYDRRLKLSYSSCVKAEVDFMRFFFGKEKNDNGVYEETERGKEAAKIFDDWCEILTTQ